MKTCTKCGECKPKEEFSETSNPVLSFRGDCRKCESTYNSEYYKKNKERIATIQKLRILRAKDEDVNRHPR
jgi:hypothetical protein